MRCDQNSKTTEGDLACHKLDRGFCTRLGWTLNMAARLQIMAVFDEISGAEKAQILDADAQNSCQVQIMRELRGKTKNMC